MTHPDEGVPIPDPKQLSSKELLEKLAYANRELQEERKKVDRRIYEEQAKSRMDLERLRGTTANHTRDLENQNSALLKSLSRLQIEVEKLQVENMTLKIKLDGNGRAPTEQTLRVGVGDHPHAGMATSAPPASIQPLQAKGPEPHA
jgi:hypothetical protein